MFHHFFTGDHRGQVHQGDCIHQGQGPGRWFLPSDPRDRRGDPRRGCQIVCHCLDPGDRDGHRPARFGWVSGNRAQDHAASNPKRLGGKRFAGGELAGKRRVG